MLKTRFIFNIIHAIAKWNDEKNPLDIRIDPNLSACAKPEDYNRLSDISSESIDDDILQALKPGQGAILERRDGLIVIYYNDGKSIFALIITVPDDIRHRLNTYSEQGFSLKEYEELESEKVYYLITL